MVDPLVIEALARDVAELEAQVVTYRGMVQEALQQLHESLARQDRQAEQLQALKDELRRYTREQVA